MKKSHFFDDWWFLCDFFVMQGTRNYISLKKKQGLSNKAITLKEISQVVKCPARWVTSVPQIFPSNLHLAGKTFRTNLDFCPHSHRPLHCLSLPHILSFSTGLYSLAACKTQQQLCILRISLIIDDSCIPLHSLTFHDQPGWSISRFDPWESSRILFALSGNWTGIK